MYKTSDIIKKLDKPVLTRKEIPYNSALVFNASVAKYNGKYVMLFRNDYGDFEKQRLDGTNIGFATSDNGIDWTVADRPCFQLSDEEINRIAFNSCFEFVKAFGIRIRKLGDINVIITAVTAKVKFTLKLNFTGEASALEKAVCGILIKRSEGHIAV